MQHTNKLVILWLLCSVVNLVLCKSLSTEQQTVDDDVDGYQGDDYDYGEDDEINKSNENQVVNARLETNIPTKPPYFEHPEIELHAKPGDDVLINCDVRNFQINNVVMWYKNETAITNGQFAMSNAVQVMRNNSILLRNVNSDDADDYYCLILPQKIRMHAKLLVSDVLVITLDGRVVTNHVVTLKQGGIHTLECKTYLETNPKIKWSLNGQRAENVVTKVEGGVLVIDNIDDAQAGQYTCLADDNSDNLPHGMVTIDVHYSPKASTHRHHVNTEAGKTAELYCDYKANPIAITNWLRNGQAISYSEKHTIRSVAHKHQNRTMLTIKDVNANDLGEYECLVENTLGSSSVKIHLIYEPETPQFEDMEVDGRTVRLHWIVRSMQPLSEAILDYKMDGAYTWSTVTVLHTQRHNEHSGIWKITHEMDLPVGEWHSRVKTKNTIGWSKFSPEHDFVVHDDDEDVVEEVPNSPPGDLVMAGIGAGSSKGNGGSSQTTITNSIFTMSLLCLSLLTKFFVPSL